MIFHQTFSKNIENIKFIPHFACLHNQTLKTTNSAVQNISLSSKLEERVDCFVCRWNYSCRQRLYYISSHYDLHCFELAVIIIIIPFTFEEQMWPLMQSSIFTKIINLMVKRTSTSIKGQVLFRKFIKPTISLGVSLHILSHHHAIHLLKDLLVL